jgi:murein L,D-transpeptidase YcbB/YkuD
VVQRLLIKTYLYCTIDMTEFAPVKRKPTLLLLFFIALALCTFQSCRKKRSEVANELFKKTHNPIFQQFTPEGFDTVFQKVFAQESSKLNHPDFIKDFYAKNKYSPVFTTQHLFNGDIAEMVNYYMHANEHGLDARLFNTEELRSLIAKFADKTAIINIDEAYDAIARLEILSANSLINYTNDLQYGVINPKKIYQRYFIATKRPDSLSMTKIFHIADMQGYLESVQPKNPQYIALQKILATNPDEETKRLILVNLERLRWRNKPFEAKYVIVNVADFTLDVIDSGKSVLNMKVCVGQGRNMDNANTLLNYNDTTRVDKPGEHETPLLNSMIHSVDVNPVWNIPRSIANKEILVEAAKDRYYLSNRNINVYREGKLIDNPEDIDWTKVTKENSDYDFKQNPGEDNSLGKIKFLFKNRSNVYLHDTPAKSAFYHKMRAVSHGCVRLGNPQALALNLFGEGDKYQEISTDMSQDNPNPTTINLPKKIPVYITYVTCWMDQNNELQKRNDVYGLDIVLYDHLLHYLNSTK